MTRSARYAVGIDLGTTNSAVAFLALGEEAAAHEVVAVPQLVAPGQVD